MKTGPQTIFVVDDHPIIRSAVRLLLEEDPGFECIGEASTAKEAVGRIPDLRPDAVVLDLWLGGNDGIEMTKCLRATAPRTALLCYTMNDARIYGERALRAGAAGFLSKKEPQEKLILALRTVCRGERYVDRSLSLSDVASAAAEGEVSNPQCLTDRELQVFHLLGQAVPNPEIARRLGVSVKTVHAHRENIKRKLGLHSSGELLRQAVLMTEGNRPCP